MGYIYKATNLVNNKMYIGLTSNHYSTRWKDHIRRAFNAGTPDYNCHFHQAIRKYGVDSFQWEVIEECLNEQLFNREKYWIEQYKTYDFGYNMTRGGEGILKYNDNDLLLYWNQGLCIKEICEKLTADKGQISSHLKALGISSDDIIKRGYEKSAQWHIKTVYQYTLEGNFIQQFDSSAQVYQLLGIKNVAECCLGKRKTAGGYRWSFNYSEKLSPLIKEQSKGVKKLVGQYDINTNKLINTYESAAEAARQLNCTKGSISNCCRGVTKTSCGYIWKYIEN